MRSRDDAAAADASCAGLLAVGLMGPTVGLVAAQAYRGEFDQAEQLGAASAVALVPLALSGLRNAGWRSVDRFRPALNMLGLALLLSCVSGVANWGPEVAARTFYLLGLLGALFLGGAALSARGLRWGLRAIAITEIAQLLLFVDRWNSNAAASHAVVAGGLAIGLARGRNSRIVAALALMAAVVALGSRTALVGVGVAMGIGVLLGRGWRLRRRHLMSGVAVALVGMATAQSPACQARLERIADSDTVVGEFLSKGKGDRFVEDPFNRRAQWEKAVAGIVERPLVGWGAGRERLVTGDLRAHSAYLTAALQFGVCGAFAWLVFYLTAILNLQADFRWTGDREALMGLFLLVYMVVAGITESSGLLSLFAPVNLVALAILFQRARWPVGGRRPPTWSVAHRPRPRPTASGPPCAARSDQ